VYYATEQEAGERVFAVAAAAAASRSIKEVPWRIYLVVVAMAAASGRTDRPTA